MVIWSVNLAQSTTSIFSDDSWSLTTVRCKLKLAQLFYWPAKQALVWLQYVFADSPVELWEYRLLIELPAKATNGLEIALWSDFTERQLDDISKINFSLFYLSKLLETEQCRKGKMLYQRSVVRNEPANLIKHFLQYSSQSSSRKFCCA